MNADSCYTCGAICDEYFCRSGKLYCDKCNPLCRVTMNSCGWCCNKTPEDKLIETIDGKFICVTCVDDYNEEHKDTSYDECDGCGKGYLCQYGQGLQPSADQFCPSCTK